MLMTKQEVLVQAEIEFKKIKDDRWKECLELLNKHHKLETKDDVSLPSGYCHFRSILLQILRGDVK